MGYGSYSAAVAEVSVARRARSRCIAWCSRSTAATRSIRDQIAAQVEGSVAYGLRRALYGEITVEGRPHASSPTSTTIAILRLAEMPKVETVIVPTDDFWGGVGEPTICVVAPAVMNAIFAATGKPVRTLPLKNLGLA